MGSLDDSSYITNKNFYANLNTEEQDPSYYFMIIGIGSLAILVAWFLLKKDEDEIKDDSIPVGTMCYPNIPKTVCDILNTKEVK